MVLDGATVPGDLVLMVRCMVEELLQVGLPGSEIQAMSHDENYQALFAARRSLGDARMDELIEEASARVGWFRHRTVEHTGNVQAVTLTCNQTSAI